MEEKEEKNGEHVFHELHSWRTPFEDDRVEKNSQTYLDFRQHGRTLCLTAVISTIRRSTYFVLNFCGKSYVRQFCVPLVRRSANDLPFWRNKGATGEIVFSHEGFCVRRRERSRERKRGRKGKKRKGREGGKRVLTNEWQSGVKLSVLNEAVISKMFLCHRSRHPSRNLTILSRLKDSELFEFETKTSKSFSDKGSPLKRLEV